MSRRRRVAKAIRRSLPFRIGQEMIENVHPDTREWLSRQFLDEFGKD